MCYCVSSYDNNNLYIQLCVIYFLMVTPMQVEDHSNNSESTASLSSSDSGDDASSDSSDFTTPLIPKSTEPNICGERFSANNELVVGSEHSLFALNLQDNVRMSFLNLFFIDKKYFFYRMVGRVSLIFALMWRSNPPSSLHLNLCCQLMITNMNM